jgi:hypothetical protein
MVIFVGACNALVKKMLIDEINSLCQKHLGRLPNLDSPQGYNDKIQWLKLFDQRESQIMACDKVRARELVPEANRIKLLYVGKQIPTHLKYPFVIKTSHDSGTCFLIRNHAEFEASFPKLRRSMASYYGIGKGEWSYRYIEPMILCEEYIPEACIDYKFHCVEGKVKWLQVIWDRSSGKPKEFILAPGYEGIHMDEKMINVKDRDSSPLVIRDEMLREMNDMAESLASGYRYVRVDLYRSDKPLLGELTFWPRAGCYKSPDEPIFGKMLDFDMSYKLEPICK